MPTVGANRRSPGAWIDSNLEFQGYCLPAEESRALRIGLRFPTALCLALVVTGLVLESAVLILALVPIGGSRRHAFKLAAVWLLAVGVLLALGQTTAALVLGGVLVAVCGIVTTTNYCVPSTLLGAWWRWRGASEATT